MTKHYLHAIIFEPDEAEDVKNDIENAEEGDYIVHALYDLETQKCIMINDNIHKPIEQMIMSYLMCAADLGYEVQLIDEVMVTCGNSYTSSLNELTPIREYFNLKERIDNAT